MDRIETEHEKRAIRVSEELLRTKPSALRTGSSGRDILSLLIKANADTEGGPKLDHEEMLASMQQIFGMKFEG